MTANDVQVGGDHYKKLGQFQPWDVLRAWMTPEEYRGWMKGNAIVYLARERDKGGETDIAKAEHTLAKLGEVLATTTEVDPSSVFMHQAMFMTACGQAIGQAENFSQQTMYDDLMAEEMDEYADSTSPIDRLDALMDTIVVTIGRALSEFTLPQVENAWREVLRSNLAKVDRATGQVIRRDDGKILKPEGWTPPDLAGVLSGSVQHSLDDVRKWME